MQFFFAPLIGALSDRYGRRPVLLLSLFAFGLDYLLMGFAPNSAMMYAGKVYASAALLTAACMAVFYFTKR
jgi:MFS transporter, DHA1 family, tetracycline resistance protein